MQPFKVICVTCQAKLSVRNESLIGKIVACPRCNSMVEVRPPAAAPPADELADKSSPAVAAALAASVESTINLPAQQVSQSIPKVVESSTAAGVAAEQAAVLQASAEVAKYKLAVWSFASLAVGATLVGAVWYSGSDPSAEVTANVPPPAATEQAQPTPPEQASQSISSTEEIASADASAMESPPAVEEPLRVDGVPEEETPTLVETEANPPAAATTEQPSPTTPEEMPTEIVPTLTVEPAPRIARRFDPLDFDPEQLTLDTLDHQPTSAIDMDESAPEDDEPIVIPEPEVPATIPLVRVGPAEGEDASQRDAAKQFELLIPAVRIDRMPLIESLRLISQLSGVPISVSPDQLLMAGITPRKKVSLDVSEASISDTLTQVLEPLRLSFVFDGPQVVVVFQGAEKSREINYPVDDLVDNSTSEEELAGWIEQLVAPDSWQTAGGLGTLETTTGKLRINQSEAVQYQVLILLERLRLARNLPPRSRYPVKRLAGAAAQSIMGDKLNRKATFTFSQFTPIGEVFDHWQTELGAPLLIDWPALAEAGIWPETTIACAIVDQPWSEAFEKVLAPTGLGWRATTGGAVEITSSEKVQAELQLEIYPLRSSSDDTRDRLRQLVSQQRTSQPADDPAATLVYDSVGSVVLALQPAATQRAIYRDLQQEQLLSVE